MVGSKLPQLWKIKALLRIKIFMWLAARNRILTTEILTQRGWQGPSICVLCYNNEKNLEHLLFRSTYVRALWRLLFHCKPTIAALLVTTEGDAATRWTRCRGSLSRQSKTSFDLCFVAACWEIWKERNSRIFTAKCSPFEDLGKTITNLVKF